MPVQSDGIDQNINNVALARADRLDRQARIRALNDALRRTGQGGRVLLTASVAALPAEQQAAIMAAVAGFDEFDDANDPHDEHDSALVDVDGQLIGFRIDYYDLDLIMHSPDSADPAITRRVLTIMITEEA